MLELTKEQGEERKVPDTLAHLRTFKDHGSYGIYVANGDGPIENTIELIIRLTKINYRIEGKDESVNEIKKLLKPGEDDFIMLEKVSADEAARVRLGLRFSLGTVLDK